MNSRLRSVTIPRRCSWEIKGYGIAEYGRNKCHWLPRVATTDFQSEAVTASMIWYIDKFARDACIHISKAISIRIGILLWYPFIPSCLLVGTWESQISWLHHRQILSYFFWSHVCQNFYFLFSRSHRVHVSELFLYLMVFWRNFWLSGGPKRNIQFICVLAMRPVYLTFSRERPLWSLSATNAPTTGLTWRFSRIH